MYRLCCQLHQEPSQRRSRISLNRSEVSMRTNAHFAFLFLVSIIAAIGCGSDDEPGGSASSSGGNEGGGGSSSSNSSSSVGSGMMMPTCATCECTCEGMKEIKTLTDPNATCDLLVGQPCGNGGGGAGGASSAYSACDQIGVTEGCL